MNADRHKQSVELDQALYTLHQGDFFDSAGQAVPLRAKSAKMMAMLLSEPGRIFSKDEIARELWPDLIASDESISQCVSEVRRALNDHEHAIVKTFPKRGYSISADFPDTQNRRELRVYPFRALALVLTAIVIAVVFYGIGSDQQQKTVQPSTKPLRDVVAVLPFQSLNNAGEDAYLTIGLAEDLIIQLSDLSAVSVLPSAWSFTLANDVDAPLDVASSLDARYLVYGRIHYGKKALQVSVQLIDGLDGTHVWAGKYDVARDELLTYQQAVLGNLAKAMSVALSERDEWLINMPATSNKKAFNEVLKGRVAASEFSNQANLLAEKHFREAVRLDPN